MKAATNMGGIYLGDPVFDPLIEEWDRRGLLVIIHPCRARLRMVTDDSHIVYGSDFPHSPAKDVLAKKKHFDENPEYDGIRERIYKEYAAALLSGGRR